MKRIFYILLLLLAVTQNMTAKISHPSLLFTPDRIEAAKKSMRGDKSGEEAWESIKREADKLLERDDVRKMEYLALAYQMTGDKRYAEKLRAMLLAIAKITSWGDPEMMMREPAWRSELQMAHKSFQLAVAYDAVYNDLTESERKMIATGLWRLAGEPLLGDWLLEPTRIHSLNSMGHNWWTSCVGMGGLLALSISNEVPEAAESARLAVESLPEWFGFAGDEIQKKPKTFDRSGGMYESINYASFGISQALLLRLAWLNSHPGDRLPEIDQMKYIPAFFAQVSYPRTGELHSINFGDSHKNVTGEWSMILAYAMGVKDPVTLWYINELAPGQFREGLPLTYPMGFLYSPDTSKAPSEPALPTSRLWEDFGWATMRDSWKKDATMLAVKSGMTWNHSHADANSLILFHKGVDIIKDAGNCSYGQPEYRNYFFQCDAHNVVKFNGQGQPKAQQYHGSPLPGNVSDLLDSGDVKYVMANGTGPMSRWLSRNYRHFLWLGNVIYVVDDIVSHEPGTFEWLWHPGGEVRKRGGDLEITSGESSVVLRPLYPEPLAPSGYVHDYPNMLWWEEIDGPTEDLKGTERYYSFHLPKTTDRIKGVNAIILKDTPEQADLPVMKRREGKNWIGLRSVHNGKVTDIYINQLADGSLMHLNSWIDADGWFTDAYMLAVTYDENTDPMKSGEVTMIYGSALRNGKRVIHGSRSKKNLTGSLHDGKLKVKAFSTPSRRN